jgi:hypothetical protein
VIAEVSQRRQDPFMSCLSPVVSNRAPIPHVLIARLQCLLQSRFLGLIKKAHLASAINARFVDAPHGVFCQLTGFRRASEHAGERVEIAHDCHGIATFIQTPRLPRFNTFNRDGGERFRIPGSEMPIQLIERVGSGARTAGVDPRRICVGDERSERDTVSSSEALQRMAAMHNISQHLLTSLPRFIRLDCPHLTECDAPISTEPSVVGSDTAGLHPQGETG